MRYFSFVASVKEDGNSKVVRGALWAKSETDALCLAYRREPRAYKMNVSLAAE